MFNRNVIAVLVFILILIAIPLTVYVSRQEQDIRQQAGTINPTDIRQDECGKVKFSIVQTSPNGIPNLPDEGKCPDLATINSQGQIVPRGNPNGSGALTQSFNKIGYNIVVESLDGQQHEVEISTSTFFCDSPYGKVFDNQNGADYFICDENSKNHPEDGVYSIKRTVSSSQPFAFTVERGSLTGASCGSYQFDLKIESVDGNTSCNTPIIAQMCQTGLSDCSVPSPTPTPGTPACPAPAMPKNVKINCPNCTVQ